MNVLPVLDAVLARLREKLPQLQVSALPAPSIPAACGP